MSKELVKITMEINRGDDLVEVDVEGYIIYSVDYNYGSDADGGRGCSRTIVDDIQEIESYDMDGFTVKLTEKEIEEASELLTNKFLEG